MSLAQAARATAARKPATSHGAAILLRVFCHAYGDRLILLLAGYDKGAAPGKRRQAQEIALARRRLAAWERSRRA